MVPDREDTPTLRYDTLLAEPIAIETTAADLLLHAGQRPLDTAAIATTR